VSSDLVQAPEGGETRPPTGWARFRGRPVWVRVLVLMGSVLLLLAAWTLMDGDGRLFGTEPAATATVTGADADAEALYPDRQHRRQRDLERPLGEPVTIGGLEARVLDVSARTDATIDVTVELRNTADEPRYTSTNSWTMETPSDQVIVAAFRHQWLPGELPTGELPSGETVTGTVIFTVGEETGAFYVMWDPHWLPRSPRGVWRIDLE
jgi:hypothetical protein